MLKPCMRRTPVIVLALLPVSALAGPAAQRFTLARYVPHDCFLCTHTVHNPERNLVEARWSRVFEEVKKSGIDTELKKLILTELPAADHAEFEQTWDTAVKLVHGVRWGELMAKEFLLAERFGGIKPDIILLFRSSADSVESNVEGLRAILDTLASLGKSTSVAEGIVHGTKVWSLGAPKSPLSLHLFNREDVIGIVLGERALNDVLALATGEEGVKAIVDLPRFKEAVAGLPEAENNLVFFDVQTFVRSFNRMVETVFTQKSAKGEECCQGAPHPRRPIVANIIRQCDFIDYVTTSTRTEGLREVAVTTTRLRPDAMDKPLSRMLTAQEPFEEFDKYVPKEATGFWVSSFVDLHILYQFILGFIRDEIPGGPAALERWAEIQRGIDFDVEADLFSWWSGEIVKVSLPPAIKGPFASGDFVLLIRVKDAKLADAKVSAGIDRLAALFREYEQPLMISSNGQVDTAGFRSVTHPLLAGFGVKFVIGVVDDRLVIGNSAAAIDACLATAAGKAPSIVDNERFKKEGLVPKGPVCGASFSDLSNLGQELGSIFAMAGMFGSFIPDKPNARPAKAMIGILGRLSPAVAQIDFLSSSATVCTFDGQAWTTTQVTNYKPAPKPAETAPKTGKAQATAP